MEKVWIMEKNKIVSCLENGNDQSKNTIFYANTFFIKEWKQTVIINTKIIKLIILFKLSLEFWAFVKER